MEDWRSGHKLKVCPFCGSKAERINYLGNAYQQYRVRCSRDKCNEGTYHFDHKADAVKAWNMRTGE